MEHGYFAHNRATFTGGAIYADDASSTDIYVEYVHRKAENIPAGCFIRFGDELVLEVRMYTNNVSAPVSRG